VAGGDQLPFGAAGGQAAALESRDAAEVFGAGEHGLDDVLALAVKRCSLAGLKQRLDASGLWPLAR
jgi:hypothetical protein